MEPLLRTLFALPPTSNGIGSTLNAQFQFVYGAVNDGDVVAGGGSKVRPLRESGAFNFQNSLSFLRLSVHFLVAWIRSISFHALGEVCGRLGLKFAKGSSVLA